MGQTVNSLGNGGNIDVIDQFSVPSDGANSNRKKTLKGL